MNEEVTTFTQLRMLAERSRAYGTSLAVDITQALMDVAEVAGDAQDAADTAQQGVSDLKEELQNLNDIKDFNLYWCLWSSGTERPPENDQITYAICGTAVCGLTICGLTEGDFWTTTEPYTVDNLYKWVKIYIELEDGTVKWLGPYCLTDNYTRDLAHELETSITDLQTEINNLATNTDDMVGQLNEAVTQLNDEVTQLDNTITQLSGTVNDMSAWQDNTSQITTTSAVSEIGSGFLWETNYIAMITSYFVIAPGSYGTSDTLLTLPHAPMVQSYFQFVDPQNRLSANGVFTINTSGQVRFAKSITITDNYYVYPSFSFPIMV